MDSFDREDQTVVIMMDHVDAVEEEIVEGMEHSDEGQATFMSMRTVRKRSSGGG